MNAKVIMRKEKAASSASTTLTLHLLLTLFSLLSLLTLLFTVPHLSASPVIHPSQEIDPFYIQLLNKAERFFLEGDHQKAIEQLEIAAFGLLNNKILQAKANIYLSLAHYHLRHTEKSEAYARQVVDNLTQQELERIDIPDQSLQEFTGLLARFQLSGYESETRVVVKREENTTTNPTPEETAADLEERIQANPSNIVLFYDLYELYKSDHNLKKARKTLEKLVEEHPDEVYAFYLLGLMRFQQGKFKDAEKHFTEALRPRSNLIISEDLTEEVRAYQILSAYLRGDENRAREMMAESIHIFTEAKINDLPLDANNKRLLLSLK